MNSFISGFVMGFLAGGIITMFVAVRNKEHVEKIVGKIKELWFKIFKKKENSDVE